MKCPGCAAPVDFERPDCPSCKTNYTEAFERRAAGPRAEPPSRPAPRPQRVWPRALALGALAAIAAFSLRPSAAPPPDGALRDLRHGFSFSPPPGWSLETDPSGLSLRDGAATIRVRVLPGELPAEPLARAQQLAAQAFNGGAVRALRGAESPLGGRPGLLIELSGERAILPSADAGRQASALHAAAPSHESGELRGLLALAAAGGRRYELQLYTETSDFERRRPVFDAFLASFRLPESGWR